MWVFDLFALTNESDFSRTARESFFPASPQESRFAMAKRAFQRQRGQTD
jgi:hypothetical protein